MLSKWKAEYSCLVTLPEGLSTRVSVCMHPHHWGSTDGDTCLWQSPGSRRGWGQPDWSLLSPGQPRSKVFSLAHDLHTKEIIKTVDKSWEWRPGNKARGVLQPRLPSLLKLKKAGKRMYGYCGHVDCTTCPWLMSSILCSLLCFLRGEIWLGTWPLKWSERGSGR